MEVPDKITIRDQADFLVNIDEVALVVNEIIDYLEVHTIPKEKKSWAYTFLGDTANIRCDENIKHVMIFQGDKSYKFSMPE